jgi:hypothetical protein
MGGIVAAETLLSIVNEQPIHSPHGSQTMSASSLSDPSLLMFPYIQGILAFDTPYLGIAPGVVAHGAEKHWNTANSAVSAYNNLASAFGWGTKSPGDSSSAGARKMITAPDTAAPASKAVNDANADAASAPLWQKYGRVALFAGAAGAVAAGGAAAYMKREQISEGWSFATSHLEFVGSLARPEDMKKRLNNIATLSETLHIGFANLYTTLGHAVDSAQKGAWTGKVAGKDRTFCNVPKGELKKFFVPAVNDKSQAETLAHMSMFEPKNNPGYYTMSERAKEIIISWAENQWYEESEGQTTSGVCIEEEAEMVEKEDMDMGEEEFEDIRESAKEEFEDLKDPLQDTKDELRDEL